MRHVKLARDRRRKKFQIKLAIFFIAILCIGLGLFLGSKQDKPSGEPDSSLSTSHSQENGDIHSSVEQSSELENQADKQAEQTIEHAPLESTPKTEKTETQTSNMAKEAETDKNSPASSTEDSLDATSFYDELDAKDDEVDEVKIETEDVFADLPEDAKNALRDLFDVMDQALRIKNQFSHTVVRGDTLHDVLELSGLDDETSANLLKNYDELKHLKPGQQFYWILNSKGELEYLNWLISEREERIYERVEGGKFKRQILQKKSVWKKEVLRGKINGTFNMSLKALGLEGRQINQLSTTLQWQTNLKRLKTGDRFSLLISREYIDNKLTGQGNVEAIHISSAGKSYYAIQAGNGRYYNLQGETLSKGFARYPLQRQARVSSHFNPYRRHPITGRIAPHKGVDFAMPIGTPVIAPADGVVEKVAYQANGAGRYLVIRHGREYQTVYMHLSRPLVSAGQTIKRGQRIALSGNTGRSTGPHLHYEFHINGRAVNPLKVKLPGTSSSMSTMERKKFLVRAKEIERLLKMSQ
ncbi:murein DD-endopeptidase MepM [Pasteurella sp. PK-2025]|uniref:murein DD-endopeptidase MepM n=1 Tax=unclassified Pasteurella TaxID=2621516 RepID=UPI003C748934